MRATIARRNVGTDPDALPALAGTQDGFDVVLEASGKPVAAAAAIEHVRRGGVVVQVGNLPGGDVALPAMRIQNKEIDLRGTMRFTRHVFSQAVRLIVSGGIDVAPILTGREPLENAAAAIDIAADRTRHLKVMLVDEGA